jgi:opacity protein-like surface antigen
LLFSKSITLRGGGRIAGPTPQWRKFVGESVLPGCNEGGKSSQYCHFRGELTSKETTAAVFWQRKSRYLCAGGIGAMNYRNFDFGRATHCWSVVAGVVVALGMLGSSAALAQNCGPLTATTFNSSFDWKSVFGAGLSGANALAATIQATNTAFLTQSTALVGAPGDPKPNQDGSGLWTRMVGGESTTKTQGSAGFAYTAPLALGTDANGSTNCNTKFQQTFGGVQIGQDIGKLNINGWNVHLGTTAGVIGTQGQITGGNTPVGGAFNTTTEAPFIGTYLVATQGNFFIDGLIRFDYYQTNLDSPTINVFNQSLDAYGYSASASAGYHWDVPNTKWFVEPSVGMIWTDAKVNPFQSVGQSVNLTGTSLITQFQGTTYISDLTSLVGRAGLRVGTSFDVGELALQPFAAASVWHEFEGGFTATYSSCPNCIFQGGVPTNLTATMSGQGIGTFGQYSVGVAGQLKGTGWLGFARLDYRDGEHLEGLSGTGGIRYQFTPTAVAAMPVKAKAIDAPINWSGFYVGAIGGTDYGHGSLTFPGVASTDVRPAGVFGGGEVGYNIQSANWVYGLEGDFAGVGAQSNSACTPLNAGLTTNTALFQMNCHDSSNWVATVAARLGLLLTPRVLTYVKAGGAFEDETVSMSCNLASLNGTLGFGFAQNCANPAGHVVTSASANLVRAGWMAAFGSEFAFTQNWTAKAEVDWLGFGNQNVTLSDGTVVKSTQSVTQGKIGLNYKF